MLCYECDGNGSAVSAIAICQRCGGGVCRKHASTLSHPGAPGGMLGISRPRQEHVCSRCLSGEARSPAPPSVREQARASALPDALTAISLADTLVRRQSRVQARRRQRKRSWRRWLVRLLPWGQTAETKELSQV